MDIDTDRSEDRSTTSTTDNLEIINKSSPGIIEVLATESKHIIGAIQGFTTITDRLGHTQNLKRVCY